MTFSADLSLENALKKRADQNALRKLITPSGLIDFCSNDYLGFARSKTLSQSISDTAHLNSISNGSGGSRLLAGNSAFAEELEKKIADFHQAQAGLIYNSGYDANVGLFSSLGKSGDTIIYDELIHASVHDGIRISKASAFPFKHNDLSHLRERLKLSTGTVYVAVESVYSMDGDEASLIEIEAACREYGANLIVDEAHATGITKNGGKGLVQLYQLESKIFARVHTFGKALGCHGAIVLGSNLLRDYQINFSRSFIYTTALPLKSLIAVDQAYLQLEKSNEEIMQLQSLIKLFKESVSPAVNLIASDSPIQCILSLGNEEVKKIAGILQKQGFDARPILSPTVQKGTERLRICIHSFNKEEEVKMLVSAINHCFSTNKG
ncbi:MAG: pyridoxal phosphate-dependent aminotransferase family protein [Bacteroidota bacterium]|nr:pyridoxal phosphate-dependent aminotransferase family protein [Bacteroidota bacterium]